MIHKRGLCSRCGRDSAIRTDQMITSHTYWDTNDERLERLRCPGSGLPPVEVPDRAA